MSTLAVFKNCSLYRRANLKSIHSIKQRANLSSFAFASQLNKQQEERFQQQNAAQAKTAILMLNMGGPKSSQVDDVSSFLCELFTDRDIIKIPFQSILGRIIAKSRALIMKKKFDQIGGDPLIDWTRSQGLKIAARLDEIRVSSSPHALIPCFRYSTPNITTAFELIDQIKPNRVVMLSMYPQFSCATSGSSLNKIAEHCLEHRNHLTKAPSQRWSLIDRWPVADALVDSYAELIEASINEHYKSSVRHEDITILFSAHSIPVWMVERGDDYTSEIGGSVQAILARIKNRYSYSLVWQSRVGPLSWQGPMIEKVIKGYVRNGRKHFVVVPTAFVSEHIETLHELDIEYAKELKAKLGFETLVRVPALNDHQTFVNALATLISDHLQSDQTISEQMRRVCPGCAKSNCKLTREWLQRLESYNTIKT